MHLAKKSLGTFQFTPTSLGEVGKGLALKLKAHVPQYCCGHFKIHRCLLHICQVLRLPGAVSPDVLHIAFLQVTLTVPETVDRKNRVPSSLPILLDSNSNAKIQSQSLVIDIKVLLPSGINLHKRASSVLILCLHYLPFSCSSSSAQRVTKRGNHSNVSWSQLVY